MNGNQIFNTLSAGGAFTGIAAGFVEEMVFRGVILNALKKRWNIKVAVIVPSMLFGIVHVPVHRFRNNYTTHLSANPIAQIKKTQRSPLRLRFFICTLKSASCAIGIVIYKTMY